MHTKFIKWLKILNTMQYKVLTLCIHDQSFNYCTVCMVPCRRRNPPVSINYVILVLNLSIPFRLGKKVWIFRIVFTCFLLFYFLTTTPCNTNFHDTYTLLYIPCYIVKDVSLSNILCLASHLSKWTLACFLYT